MNAPLTAQTLGATVKTYGPLVALLVAGVAAWVTLDLNVGALAGDSKKHQEKIEANQRAIATIKLNAAVQKARDEALKDSLAEIKGAIKDLGKAVRKP